MSEITTSHISFSTPGLYVSQRTKKCQTVSLEITDNNLDEAIVAKVKKITNQGITKPQIICGKNTGDFAMFYACLQKLRNTSSIFRMRPQNHITPE